MEDLIDLIAVDDSPSNISDKIKEILFSKAAEKIEGARPEVASVMFGDDQEDDYEDAE
jgi:hypothetical protein